jgi:toxin YoeB
VNFFWTPDGWREYVAWQSTDLDMVKKINALIKNISRDHFTGLGKPEPLRGDFQGWWARRITDEHRLIYRIVGKGMDKQLEIAQCRYHYKK